MVDINLKRRSFLISSAAGLSSLVFAKSGIAQGKEAVDLLNPSSPLVLPQNFSPSIWFTMESKEQRFIFLEMKWDSMLEQPWHRLLLKS